MMNKVIVDTNIIVGIYDKKDVWHNAAQKLMTAFKRPDYGLILLDCVVNETFTVLARRLRDRKTPNHIVPTLNKVKAELPKEKITKSYQLLETDYDEIIDRIIKSKGKINFHDALIITFALNQGISLIASFDENFDDIPGITRIFDPNAIP